MTPLPMQGWLFLIEFLKWYFSKYWQVRTRWVFAQTVTYVTAFWKIKLTVTPDLFHFIAPANNYAHALPMHGAITSHS